MLVGMVRDHDAATAHVRERGGLVSGQVVGFSGRFRVPGDRQNHDIEIPEPPEPRREADEPDRLGAEEYAEAVGGDRVAEHARTARSDLGPGFGFGVRGDTGDLERAESEGAVIIDGEDLRKVRLERGGRFGKDSPRDGEFEVPGSGSFQRQQRLRVEPAGSDLGREGVGNHAQILGIDDRGVARSHGRDPAGKLEIEAQERVLEADDETGGSEAPDMELAFGRLASEVAEEGLALLDWLKHGRTVWYGNSA